MKKRFPKTGDQVEFIIKNPNWKQEVSMQGAVENSPEEEGGLIKIKPGATTLCGIIIRINSLK